VELARWVGASTEFPDGVWLVELAGVQDPELVTATAASAVRITLRSGRPPSTALAEQLGPRALLLIMDNCEHLLEACSPLIDEVLAECPNINIVTTSREPLALPGELVYRVPSLELPSGSALLEVQEQTIFRRLAVFAGGFDLDAAASVCTEPRRLVSSVVSRLVDKSLVQADTRPRRRDTGYSRLYVSTPRPS
jgi:predicted ATPase